MTTNVACFRVAVVLRLDVVVEVLVFVVVGRVARVPLDQLSSAWNKETHGKNLPNHSRSHHWLTVAYERQTD